MASLNGLKANEILKAVRKKGQEMAIDFSKFDSGKTYNELVETGQDFYLMYFYDRLEEYSGYTTDYIVLPEMRDEFVQAIKEFNENLDNYARQVAIDVIGENGDKDFLTFNDAHTAYGYCHLNIIEKTKKKAEEERLMQEAQDNDDDYEPDCSSCGDGGCVHCEPSRFIEGYIY